MLDHSLVLRFPIAFSHFFPAFATVKYTGKKDVCHLLFNEYILSSIEHLNCKRRLFVAYNIETLFYIYIFFKFFWSYAIYLSCNRFMYTSMYILKINICTSHKCNIWYANQTGNANISFIVCYFYARFYMYMFEVWRIYLVYFAWTVTNVFLTNIFGQV